MGLFGPMGKSNLEAGFHLPLRTLSTLVSLFEMFLITSLRREWPVRLKFRDFPTHLFGRENPCETSITSRMKKLQPQQLQPQQLQEVGEQSHRELP